MARTNLVAGIDPCIFWPSFRFGADSVDFVAPIAATTAVTISVSCFFRCSEVDRDRERFLERRDELLRLRERERLWRRCRERECLLEEECLRRCLLRWECLLPFLRWRSWPLLIRLVRGERLPRFFLGEREDDIFGLSGEVSVSESWFIFVEILAR